MNASGERGRQQMSERYTMVVHIQYEHEYHLLCPPLCEPNLERKMITITVLSSILHTHHHHPGGFSIDRMDGCVSLIINKALQFQFIMQNENETTTGTVEERVWK